MGGFEYDDVTTPMDLPVYIHLNIDDGMDKVGEHWGGGEDGFFDSPVAGPSRHDYDN